MKLVFYVLIHVTACAKPRWLLMTIHYSHLSRYSACVLIPLLLGGEGRGFPFESKGMLQPRPKAPFSQNGVEVGVTPRLA